MPLNRIGCIGIVFGGCISTSEYTIMCLTWQVRFLSLCCLDINDANFKPLNAEMSRMTHSFLSEAALHQNENRRCFVAAGVVRCIGPSYPHHVIVMK